jgi:hypothetical protein
MWPSGNRSDFPSLGSFSDGADVEGKGNSWLRDAPFTALMVIGTAAVGVICTDPHDKRYPITK